MNATKTKSDPTFHPGDILRFEYPRFNSTNNPHPTFVSRIIRVQEIRDNRQRNLKSATFALDPEIKRGRYLITGICLDRDQKRSFYFESMRNIVINPMLTVGVFDPCEPDQHHPLKTYNTFLDTPENRKWLATVIKLVNELASSRNTDLAAAIFSISETTDPAD